ncbi:MAG: hypothetical protein Q9M50_02275 [Methylococcales bacterium]|nr:hypothetical protein [Methylococcales bacterium]
MKQLGFYFLAFSTFWVSTWMVTDIHDWSMLEQPHPIFSIQSSVHQESVLKNNTSDDSQHFSDCRSVCSYDHGGHLGQTLLTSSVLNSFIPIQKNIFSPYASFWHFRVIPPKIRPPDCRINFLILWLKDFFVIGKAWIHSKI